MEIFCAKELCALPVKYGLHLDGLPLAYACELPHFMEIMWATRHLGERRLIEPLEAEPV